MSGLRFASPAFAALRDAMLADAPDEACGVAYAHHDRRTNSWVVAEVSRVPDVAYASRDAASAVLDPAFVAAVASRCRADGMAAVLAHTHPAATGYPAFSPVDDNGERDLRAYLDRRGGGAEHLALVIGPEGCRARILGAATEVPVWEVGSTLKRLSNGGAFGDARAERHDRQVRAFGVDGQRALTSLRVGVVGAGGTGSMLIQQLALLGVADFLVVEPDVVEETNLNRLAGATAGDMGRPKLAVAERVVRAARPEARFAGFAGDVVDDEVARKLTGLDFVFACTDSHASRAVVGQLAYQHLVPVIDLGVSVTVRDGTVTHVTGRVQMLSPGRECLWCSNVIDPAQVMREMQTPLQRAADPYVQGAHEPQPAVASLNATMASLAVTMFLGAVTPVPAAARFQVYDGVRGTVRLMSATPDPDCVVCSARGALLRGCSWPLPTRGRAT